MASKELFHRTRLSLLEIASLVIKLFLIAPWKFLLNLAHAIPLCLLRGLPLLPYIYTNLIRTLMELLSPRQVQFVLPPTGQIYIAWLAKSLAKGILTDDAFATSPGRLKRDIEALPDGRSSVLWLGDRTRATKFVLFLHGGGYVLPLDAGHLNWCMNAYLAAGSEAGDEEVAVAILQYSLCPGASYPTQLLQAVSALRLLLDRAISPADIVLGGDSCGGHMTAGLLAHILHPDPGASRIDLKGERLAGVFMVSPWLSATQTGPSFRENYYLDLVSPKIVRQSATLTLRGPGAGGARAGHSSCRVAADEYGWAMPGDVADESWWDGLDAVVRDVLVTAGRNEVLRDGIVEFAKRIRARNPGLEVQLQVRPWDAHDFILLEGQLNKIGDATKDMKSWYKATMQRKGGT